MLSIKELASPGPFRCAVVISKKIAKTAVARNRARRALYRALKTTSLPRTGHAILFVQSVPRTDLSGVFASELKKLLNV
jgi:ribonuclease P protein component